MSAIRTLPTTPLAPLPSGTDVRALRPWLNALHGIVNQLVQNARTLSQSQRTPVVPPHNPVLYGNPYQRVGVHGVYGTISGSFSSATPFLAFNYENNTAVWQASTVSPWPPDTVIFDGREGGPVTYWHPR